MAINPTHVRLAATAKRLIEKNGAAMSLVVEDDSGNSWEPVGATVTTPIIAVRTQYKSSEVSASQGRILSTDNRFLMSSAVEPVKGAFIDDGGTRYKLVDYETVAPGEVEIIYKVQGRAQ